MIRVLDEKTIDKIAAGEVVEKPASIVKELFENAVDAGASAVSIDIKNGGIDMIRVSDNGSGIKRDDIRRAFLPHATSKLTKIEDLFSISSLGFRGEALSSIAAVSKTELLTKPAEEPIGYKYVIEGGTESSFDEAGLPDGTTFIVRDMFYNTPARRKFLKSPNTEAGYITSLVEELAMARPDISVKYSVNGNNRLVTSGNGDLKELIYRIYGKDISDSLIRIDTESDGMGIKGFISKPLIARGSRGMENYFVNSRYVKDDIIAKAIEDGYAGYLMQHKFPFTALFLSIDPADIDVNVHPRKTEIKFSDAPKVYEFIRSAVRDALSAREHISSVSFDKESNKLAAPPLPEKAPEPFERKSKETQAARDDARVDEKTQDAREAEKRDSLVEKFNILREKMVYGDEESVQGSTDGALAPSDAKETAGAQLDLFEEKILSKDAAAEYKIVGQVFDTYWIIEYRDEMLLMDQHAAHEKVNYERFMEEFKNKEITRQNLLPPIVMTLGGEHRAVLERFLPRFIEMGFEIEPFGGNDFVIRTVPYNLYGLSEHEVLIALLDELSHGTGKEDISIIHEKIASMSCKAAIKGNTAISEDEAKALIMQLLTLNDPYNCPHGRPTIVKMSKRELEKKFKRVL